MKNIEIINREYGFDQWRMQKLKTEYGDQNSWKTEIIHGGHGIHS